MRTFRTAALGATLLALIVGACTSGGGSTASPAAEPTDGASPSASAEPTASAPPLSTTLTLGGPPECPDREFCLIGLQEVYGLEFEEFRPLDAGGPLTVEALDSGQIDVGVLFTSDPAIAVNDFVLLEDDKQLQLADNLIPVLRQDLLDANPQIGDLLNEIMAALSQEELTELNRAVVVDGEAAADVAAEWLEEQAILPGDGGGSGDVIVGSTNFYEQEILGELFAQTLEGNGFSVERRFQLGNREIVFPALEAGEIDVVAEYAATLLEFVNEGAGEATTDPEETAELLRDRLEPLGLTALEYAEATDQNGIVVTRETADTYGLATVSDLGKPLPTP